MEVRDQIRLSTLQQHLVPSWPAPHPAVRCRTTSVRVRCRNERITRNATIAVTHEKFGRSRGRDKLPPRKGSAPGEMADQPGPSGGSKHRASYGLTIEPSGDAGNIRRDRFVRPVGQKIRSPYSPATHTAGGVPATWDIHAGMWPTCRLRSSTYGTTSLSTTASSPNHGRVGVSRGQHNVPRRQRLISGSPSSSSAAPGLSAPAYATIERCHPPDPWQRGRRPAHHHIGHGPARHGQSVRR